METRIKVQLGDIQKTLFMPVWARAVESKKNNPFLEDETALRIIETVDYDFSQMYANIPEISQLSWIARCKRFDIIIGEFIRNHPNATIVNIGCGLDTTYERINNKSILWYDLDMPDVIELRRKFLSENEQRKFISSSFTDTKWFNQILLCDEVLFTAAGVFPYFEENEIKDFILRTADYFRNAEMFFDVTSPKGVEIANAVIEKSGLSPGSYFKWGLKDKAIIPSWDNRIKILNSYYTFKIEGLELSEQNKQIAMISDSLDIMTMLHLRIQS